VLIDACSVGVAGCRRHMPIGWTRRCARYDSDSRSWNFSDRESKSCAPRTIFCWRQNRSSRTSCSHVITTWRRSPRNWCAISSCWSVPTRCATSLVTTVRWMICFSTLFLLNLIRLSISFCHLLHAVWPDCIHAPKSIATNYYYYFLN